MTSQDLVQAGAFECQKFLTWFKEFGGWYNAELIDIVSVAGMGYGAVAVKDIEEGTPLFHIPDDLILSPYTSDLKDHLDASEWDQLNKGWAQLILVLMWETIKGSKSRWAGYLANMPVTFETPMFWTEQQREQLAGTDIADRIGREDAEAEYTSVLAPFIKAHPDLFPIDSPHITIDAFHIQGSRILSRSFTVPLHRFGRSQSQTRSDSNSEMEGDGEEEEEVVVMIPFADMLNAAWGKDNAHLYIDEDTNEGFNEGVVMKSIQLVKQSEQIYNTYDSPPNSELLRKYGHVDVLPLPSDMLDLLNETELGSWPYGNPGDEVLLQGDLIVGCVATELGGMHMKATLQDRIDWWLDEGQEDIFPLSFSHDIDDGLISFIRLLLYDLDWNKAHKKGRIPRAIIDEAVAGVLHEIINQRLAQYKENIDHDLRVVRNSCHGDGNNPVTFLGRNESAAVVRLGEKRILYLTRRKIAQATAGQKSSQKRKNNSTLMGKGKRMH
ncbi:SET domain-containing protein 6 [Cryptococcus neoformans Bt1]|nr:SET domain-containing protein 6 [Cryptococcus neoformans var. grubii Bt1]OXG29801.1 SET domain-containing protein 6 [Cryptococcus neoformans var. grubii Ze90-1]